jgi:outer membrane protein TolC
MIDTNIQRVIGRRRAALGAGMTLMALIAAPAVTAQVATPPGQRIDLTLERMVELGLRDSYRVRQLQLEVERTRSLLQAERAGLKSRIELDIAAPELQAITENKWNSDLGLNELVAENTRRFQFDLSIRQPVVLFGFPTNGYLSLNNRVYRYTQIDGEEYDRRYYNRYFIGYDQPLFQPNRMKNDLEEAELDLESSELDYQDDVVSMIDDLAGDYYELVEDAYRRDIAIGVASRIEEAAKAAEAVVAGDASRQIEIAQLQVELANAREERDQALSNLRLQVESLKQRLRLRPSDVIEISSNLDVVPVKVDPMRAIELARTLAPRLRQLAINLRENEINLNETKGQDSFRMNLGFTYGREVQDPLFRNLLREPRNSYTFDVTATVPIWDWGERSHRIRASQYSLDRTRLSIEEAESEIETNVRSQVRTLDEYASRLANMQQTLRLARENTASTLDRYRTGGATLVDLLQTINRESNTEENFLNAYSGYQETLLRLQELTYYDFENDMPIVERFSVVTGRHDAGAR